MMVRLDVVSGDNQLDKSSSPDEIETIVKDHSIDDEQISSSNWSDNDIEQADEMDVGDMLMIQTEVGFMRTGHCLSISIFARGNSQKCVLSNTEQQFINFSRLVFHMWKINFHQVFYIG
jgi:hypothetical protein